MPNKNGKGTSLWLGRQLIAAGKGRWSSDDRYFGCSAWAKYHHRKYQSHLYWARESCCLEVDARRGPLVEDVSARRRLSLPKL